MAARARLFRFGDFVLDVSAYQLRRRERPVRIERRPMDLLVLLVERRGELVTREEIVKRLWGREVYIEIDAGVNTVIRKIRRALRDSADEPRFIQTIQGKGYRFIAEVAAPQTAVLAVLPFQDRQGSAELDYVADGLTEETIANLGRIDPERLSVIGRTSSMTYRGTTKSLADIGRELGVDYLLEGSVRRGNSRYRVTATLTRAADQVQVWTETYERDAHDLLHLQTEIGQSIARQIQLRLSPERASAIARRQTSNPDAYDLYLRGRYHWNQLTPATVARALECFRRAIDLDPEYALAWAGIADAYSSAPFNGDARPGDASEQARTAASKALQVGETVAEAHSSAAFAQFVFDWDWRAAEANCRAAVALDPSYGQGYWMLAHTLSQQRRHPEALTYTRRARELDPLNAMNHSMSAQIAFQAREFEAAAAHAREALLVEPDFWIAYLQLGQAYQQLGRIEDALAALAESSRLSRGNSKPVSTAGYTLATVGRRKEAEEAARSLEHASSERYVPPYAVALVYAGLNECEKVYDWLDRAFAARDVHLIYLHIDPKWDELRQDARFAALLARGRFLEQ